MSVSSQASANTQTLSPFFPLPGVKEAEEGKLSRGGIGQTLFSEAISRTKSNLLPSVKRKGETWAGKGEKGRRGQKEEKKEG